MSSGFSFAKSIALAVSILLLWLAPVQAHAEEEKRTNATFRLGVIEAGPVVLLQWNTQGQAVGDSESGFLCWAPKIFFGNGFGATARVSAALLRESTSSLFVQLGGEAGLFLELFDFGNEKDPGVPALGIEATAGGQWWASSSAAIALSFSGRVFLQLNRKTPGFDRLYVGGGYTVLTRLTTITIQAGIGFALF